MFQARPTRALLTLSLLSMVLLSHAKAEPLDDAMNAFRERDYAKALEIYQSLAQQGNGAAESRLGDMYSMGFGVTKDYARAMEYYRKAADDGALSGLTNIGFLYENGIGVPKDYAEAMKWYRQAADKGYPFGILSIEDMYFTGKGVPQDIPQAFMWFRKSADMGYAVAQFKIGEMYAGGQGVPQDYILGYMWLELASRHSHDADIGAGGIGNFAAVSRRFLGAKMTPEQIAAAQKLADDWKPAK
jgi:TPR repeat protein